MDVPDLIFGPLMAALISSAFISILAGIHVLYRDKTVWYRITRQSFLWSFWKSPTNDIRILPVLEKDIDTSDMTFSYRGGTYRLDQVDANRNITEFFHRGRPAYIHSSGTVGPHAFTPHSLNSRMTPEALYACKDGNVRRQIDSIRVQDKISKTGVTTVILVMVVILILAFIGVAVYRYQDMLAQILAKLGGSVPATPGGGKTVI